MLNPPIPHALVVGYVRGCILRFSSSDRPFVGSVRILIFSYYSSVVSIFFAGIPAQISPFGILFVTTAPAPMTQFFPI